MLTMFRLLSVFQLLYSHVDAVLIVVVVAVVAAAEAVMPVELVEPVEPVVEVTVKSMAQSAYSHSTPSSLHSPNSHLHHIHTQAQKKHAQQKTYTHKNSIEEKMMMTMIQNWFVRDDDIEMMKRMKRKRKGRKRMVCRSNNVVRRVGWI